MKLMKVIAVLVTFGMAPAAMAKGNVGKMAAEDFRAGQSICEGRGPGQKDGRSLAVEPKRTELQDSATQNTSAQ